MIQRRPITTDVATAAAANAGDEIEITINDPLPVRLAELERRISAALTGERTAHDLANLLMQCDLAVPQAEEFAKAELERALDWQVTATDAREAKQAAEDATFAANRLRTIRGVLLQRYQSVSAKEQRDQYLARYADLKIEGAALGAELADLYGAVMPLVEVFGRLRVFQQKCRALHLTDTQGGLPHVSDPELAARGLGGFTGDNPSLLQSVRLHDWQSGKEIWPPFQPPFAAQFVLPVPQHPGAAWCSPEYLAAQHAERVAEQEKMARHYESQSVEQEARENKTLRENWEASQRRS